MESTDGFMKSKTSAGDYGARFISCFALDACSMQAYSFFISLSV
jgi:hypothetical protein